MNKKMIYIIVLVCTFFTSIKNTYCLENNQVGYIGKNGVAFKSEPNYRGSNVLDSLDTGDEIKLIDTNVVESEDINKCSSGFYKVSFYWESYNKKTYTGYVCGNDINFNIDTTPYQEEFANSNIPEIYWKKLSLLKLSHPNWKFTGYNTGLNWEEVVNVESQVGMSYIQSSNPIYLSLDPGSYNPNSGEYYQQESGGWYAANKQTVAYYIDPRNFLDEINIFMFENLGYNPNYQTKEVIQNIFKNTDLLPYSDIFINAATYDGNNISPIALAARSRQEVVKSDGKLSDSANGSSFKGTQVYNFYNFGAFSSCKIDNDDVYNPVMCGLKYAYNNGWTDAQTAITQGAQILARSYINAGQNTLYFQRWNVTKNNTYSHQYMTNISAPVSEGASTYNAYSSIDGLLNSSIEFVIPVYNNMPNEASKLPINVDKNKINELKTNSSINDVVSKSGYNYHDSYVTIPLGTTAAHMIIAIKTSGGSATITRDGNNIGEQEKLGTADIVNITVGQETRSYRIIVKGDVNGDGNVSAIDYVKIRKHLMNAGSLTGSFEIAGDIDNDGSIKAIDYVKVRKYLMGTGEI